MTVLVLSGMPGTGSAGPAARCDGLHPAGDVGERDDDQLVARPRVVVQAGVLVGLENDVQIALCRRGIRRSRRPAVSRRRYASRPDVPVGAQLDQQPVAVNRHGGIGRRVDADELAVAQLVDLVVEEVDGAAAGASARSPASGPATPRRPRRCSPLNSVSASSSGVPRRQRLTSRGYTRTRSASPRRSPCRSARCPRLPS